MSLSGLLAGLAVVVLISIGLVVAVVWDVCAAIWRFDEGGRDV